MTADIDIWRAAKRLIDQHGEDAAFVAAQRADAMLDAGDLDGLATWKRILKAIGELSRGKKPGERVQ